MNRVVEAATAVSVADSDALNDAERAFTKLLQAGIKKRASVMHLEPHATTSLVRLRIDGRLVTDKSVLKHEHAAIVAIIKTHAGLEQKKSPQSGTFSYKLGKQTVEVHATCLPTVDGERVTLELLPSDQNDSIAATGLWGKSLQEVGHMLASPRGMLLVSGNTPKNLTKTLGGLLEFLQHPNITIAQLGADGMSRAAKLQLAMQANPDVITINTLDSAELAHVALEAANHHLVIAVLPSPNPVTAIAQVLNWLDTDDHFLLNKLFVGMLFVANEARLCPECRTSQPLSGKDLPTTRTAALIDLVKAYQAETNATAAPARYNRNPKGCKACGYCGTNGQVNCTEVLPRSLELAKACIQPMVALRQLDAILVKSAVMSLQTDRTIKAISGEIAWR